MHQLMVKMLALPFYRSHTGFFVLLYLIGFGFIRNVEHLAIASYFSANTYLLLLLMLLWLVYYLRTAFYIQHLITQSQNFYWLQQFVLFSSFNQVTWLSFTQLIINLPIAIYTLFIAVQGIILQFWGNVFLIFIFNVIVIFVPVIFYRRVVMGVLPEEKISKLSNWFALKWAKPKEWWFPLYMIHYKPLPLLMSKLFSGFIIITTFQLFYTDAYDWRFLAIGIFIAFYFNSILVYNHLQFETIQLSKLLNLPTSFLQRSLQHLLNLFLISLPEYLIIIRYWPLEGNYLLLLQLLFFGLSILWMLHQFMWHMNFNLQKLSAHDFLLFVTVIVLLLFSVPVYFFVAVFLAYGLLINYGWYRFL